jgi:hypothetical protein
MVRARNKPDWFRFGLHHPELTQQGRQIHKFRAVSPTSWLYCSPVLRHSAGLIQAANFRSAVVF